MYKWTLYSLWECPLRYSFKLLRKRNLTYLSHNVTKFKKRIDKKSINLYCFNLELWLFYFLTGSMFQLVDRLRGVWQRTQMKGYMSSVVKYACRWSLLSIFWVNFVHILVRHQATNKQSFMAYVWAVNRAKRKIIRERIELSIHVSDCNYYDSGLFLRMNVTNIFPKVVMFAIFLRIQNQTQESRPLETALPNSTESTEAVPEKGDMSLLRLFRCVKGVARFTMFYQKISLNNHTYS